MTKRTLKITLVFWMLVLALCCALIACSDPAETPEDEGGETPPAPVTIDLVVDGRSDYTIVYDDSDAEITEHVKTFVKKLDNDFFVAIKAVGISEAEDDYGHEIVIGNVRASAAALEDKLSGGDFGMCIAEDDLVMCATNSRLYAYLLDIVVQRVFAGYDLEVLTVSSDKNFTYQGSELKDMNYVEYLKKKNVTGADLIERIFTYESFTAKDGTTLPYRLYLPFEYDESKDYPVLIVLHGAGERGTDNKGNVLHMLPTMFSHAATPLAEAIVICPQCPAAPDQWVDTPWANGSYRVDDVPISNELEAVMELLETLEATYATDPDRYYVTGLSMGGFGTWDLLMRYPDVFAAGVPICGGADPSYAEYILNVPIYTVHSTDDPIVPVKGTQDMVKALKDAGSTVIQYTELEGKGHGVWNWTAENASIWKWLFEQSLADR